MKKSSSCAIGTKLNKSQLQEFAASAISEEYAIVNFRNITKKYAPTLLKASDEISKRVKGSALEGGWVDTGCNVLKPKSPRTSRGQLIKYESLAKPQLVEVMHPEGVEVDERTIYLIEGLKKGVAVAERTKTRVLSFLGLSHGLNLTEVINGINGDLRLILDNDSTLGAIKIARSFIGKLRSDIKIGIFRGFKGIDDALVGGMPFEQVKFVNADEWSANFAGYTNGHKYVFSSPRFQEVEIPTGISLVMIQAEKGVGKTWFMEYLARKFVKSRNIFVGTHRINLSRANCRRLGIPYIEDDTYAGGSVGLCIDSILKLNLSDFIGAVIFIDEIVQVLDHLLNSSTLRNKRSAVCKKLSEILQTVVETGGLIVTADADMDAKSIKLIKALGNIPDNKCFQIKNTFIFDKGLAKHSYGVPIKENGVALYPVDVVKKIRDEALAGKKLFVCLSAQKTISKYSTQTLEAYLIANGVPASEILRVDSETIGDKRHPGYKAAEKINQLCEKYRIILASPSLNTGVDITYPNFDYVIGIASGMLCSDGVRQFLGRVRNWNVERIIYAPEEIHFSKEVALTSQSELQDYIRAHDEVFKTFDEDWFSEMHEEHRERLIAATTDYYLVQAREKECERFEYAKRIKQGLLLEGYTVEVFDSNIGVAEAHAIHKELTKISKELDLEEKLQRENAEIITDEDAKELYKAVTVSVEDKRKLEAYEIRHQLNLEPTVEIQTELATGKKVQLENNFAALEGYEISKHLWQKAQYWASDKQDSKEVTSDFVSRNARMLRIAALHKVNFFTVIRQEFGKTESQALIEGLLKDSINQKLFSLSNNVGSDAVKTVRRIAESFNFEVKKVRTNAKGERFYKATDKGFVLSDSIDVKPRVFEHWKEKRQKQVDNWLAFKVDFGKVKLGARLDRSKSLPELSEDFKYASLSTRARTMPMPVQPGYTMVSALNAANFTEWLKNQSELAIDIETYGDCKHGGLNHLFGQIRLIQFASLDAIWVLEKSDFDLFRNDIKALLLNPNQRKIGHNFMFDLRFLRKEFGVLAHNCADTMLGSRCLLGDMGADKITSHSLQSACENFLGIDVDKTEQRSDWGDTLTVQQIEYAARDPWLTIVLYKRLEAATKKPSLMLLPFPDDMAWEAWEVENRFLFSAQQMESTGYAIDVPALVLAKQQYTSVRDELRAKWNAPFSPTQKEKLRDYLNDKYGLSLKSVGKATAAENTHLPEIVLMQQICACDAIIHQLEAIERQVEINKGRVKPVFRVLSGTGRTSSGATKIDGCLINLQSLAARVNPVLKDFKLPALKALFKTQLIIDLPASHGRISAELGNDENALAAYMDESIDLHCNTAAAVGQAVFPEKNLSADWVQANKKCDPLAKGLRDTSKNTYYGWLNGAGVATIQKQIKSNLQINADRSACQKALEGLQSVFSGTTNYAKAKLKDLEQNQFVVNGIVCGWMQFSGTYLCWRLGSVGGDLKVPATKAFAGIWSRTESLLMKRACYRIAEKFAATPEWQSSLQNFIHDEVNAEIGHPDAALFAHSVVKEEFGSVCHRTVVGFDALDKCYPMENWSQK